MIQINITQPQGRPIALKQTDGGYRWLRDRCATNEHRSAVGGHPRVAGCNATVHEYERLRIAQKSTLKTKSAIKHRHAS